MVTSQVAATSTRPAQGMTGGALAVLLTATFIGAFDFFVVNVAAPSLQRDLHTSDALLQLVVGGYAFAYAAGLITGGRLGDLFGHRRMYVAGMVAFTVSSLACGLARSPVELVAARLAEGLSAAAMLPQVLALITATIPPPSRPRALGLYGLAAGAGSIAGQVLGGVLVSANLAGLGWRLIFLINLPIGAVTAALAARWLPEPATRRGRANLDLPGALGVACTLALALLPLTVGADEGWPPWTWAALGAAVPAGAATLWRQRALGRRGGQPVIDLSLFRHWTFRAGLAANACFLAYFGSFMFALTLFLQDGLRLDALQAGLAFAPAGLAFSAAALVGPRVLHRYGPRAVVAGSLITVAALALLLVLAQAGDNRANLPWIILVAAVGSLGNGIVLPALIGTSLVKVAPHQAGAGSGLLTTAQQFASSAGVAVIGTVFFAIAGRSHPAPADFAAGMTAAAGACLALLTAVTVLTALIARTTRRDESPRRPDAHRT
jgi:EmrB/QacA subfamily drug resistance transporter